MPWQKLFLICLLLFIVSSVTDGRRPIKKYETVFLVDSSKNVRNPGKYDLIRQFVVNLTLELVKSPHRRVGIVSFSGEDHRMVLPLTNDASMVHQIDHDFKNTGGHSYVSSALNFTMEKMFDSSVHVADGKQIVTVLGGLPDNYDHFNGMATSLKAKGLEMYCVGVGDDFFKSTKELKALASLPIKDHTLRTTFKSLLTSASVMLRKLKKVGYGSILKRKSLNEIKEKTKKTVQQTNLFKNSQMNDTVHAGSSMLATKNSTTIFIRRENVAPAAAANTLNTAAGVAAKKPSAAATAATMANPPIASADLGYLIRANSSNLPTGSAACVGHVPAANRIVTDGKMVTGIVADNTVVPSNSRACDPSKTLEQNMNMGDSGVDSTWDYGKK